MNTHSLTFPTFLPGAGTRSSERGFRLPVWLQELSQNLEAKLPLRDAAPQAERRLVASARRGHRIVLGTAVTPYEPLLLDGAPLTALRPFDDLDVVITTRSPEICEELALLIELDVRHAVTVDFLIATGDPTSPDLEEQLRAVDILAAEGLTTRLVLGALAQAENGAPLHRTAANLRRLFEIARRSRAFDVTVAESADVSSDVVQLVERLQLEYGFPSRLPGRG